MLDGLDRLMDHEHFSDERTTDERKGLCNAYGGAFDRFMRNGVELTGDAVI